MDDQTTPKPSDRYHQLRQEAFQSVQHSTEPTESEWQTLLKLLDETGERIAALEARDAEGVPAEASERIEYPYSNGRWYQAGAAQLSRLTEALAAERDALGRYEQAAEAAATECGWPGLGPSPLEFLVARVKGLAETLELRSKELAAERDSWRRVADENTGLRKRVSAAEERSVGLRVERDMMQGRVAHLSDVNEQLTRQLAGERRPTLDEITTEVAPGGEFALWAVTRDPSGRRRRLVYGWRKEAGCHGPLVYISEDEARVAAAEANAESVGYGAEATKQDLAAERDELNMLARRQKARIAELEAQLASRSGMRELSDEEIVSIHVQEYGAANWDALPTVYREQAIRFARAVLALATREPKGAVRWSIQATVDTCTPGDNAPVSWDAAQSSVIDSALLPALGGGKFVTGTLHCTFVPDAKEGDGAE